MRSPVAKGPILCEWAGFSCPPLWPPIGWHFLETGSLHPPPALRRFPCPPGFAPHSLPRTRRAGCPHPAAPDLHRTSCKRCHCEASAHTGCGNPHPPVIASRRGTFCQQRQKVPKERRQNQWFWNPLRARDAFRVENLLPRAPNAQVYRRAFVSSLRHHPLAAHAGPRCPGAAGMPPCVYRAARCGHRALRNSIDKRCVGGDVPDAPFHRIPCHAPVGRGAHTPPSRTCTVLLAKGVIAKPVRTLTVAIRIPLLLPPGGAHHTSGRGRARPYASQENTPHRLPTLLRPITKK